MARMTRPALTLLETIVLLAIIGTVLALFAPALMGSRAKASTASCANNLRQIGMGIVAVQDTLGEYPHVRLCPAPWRNGQDPHCQNLPAQNYYSGPLEQWWSPYDNRPGTTATQSLPDFRPNGLLWEFAGQTQKLFRCPEGIDRTVGSPTYGQPFQISYAIDPEISGRKISGSNRPFPRIWEHDDLPVCNLDDGPHWAPPGADHDPSRHRPKRHQGRTNQLGHDGSVTLSPRGQ